MTGAGRTSARMISAERWAIAQAAELRTNEDEEAVREWLAIRRETWRNILSRVQDRLHIGSDSRVLEVGGGALSFFLALQAGRRTAVDTVYQRLFELYPDLRALPEYAGVDFIASRLEDLFPDSTFDLLILINMLDHVQDPPRFVQHLDRLVTDNGMLLIIVDTYADPIVRRLVRDSDVDIPHPHHFLHEDLLALFPRYDLIFYDPRIWTWFFSSPARSRPAPHIPLYRPDRLLARMRLDIREWGRQGDLRYAAKFSLVYGLSLLLSALRRKDPPAHPLKRRRLYLFQRRPS